MVRSRWPNWNRAGNSCGRRGHLEGNGTKEITAVIEITNNVFGEVSYSIIEIAGLKKWYSAFAYGGTRGDPKKSPFE